MFAAPAFISQPLVLAQTDATTIYLLLIVAVFVILAISTLIFLATRYKRCPSNRILVIYGKTGAGQTSRCIHGGAAMVWPFIQDYSFLSLEPIQIEIPLRGALSAENIRVNVPSVFTVAVGTEPGVMQNAAIRLMGLSTQEVKHQAQDIIFGQLRQVIAGMGIEEINRDRDKFLHNVQDSLEPELRKIGLVLINVNITDITDDSNYIEAIGQKAAAVAIQQAKVDVAEQEKKGAIGVAIAEREKAIQVANANKEREIGIRTAERERAIRVAELVKEQKIGEQTAAYEQEARVKEAEQQMRISTSEANAQAVAGENTAQAKIAVSQAELLVRKSEAYQVAESRKAEAEAAVLEQQNRAMAKAAIAQAERVEAEQRAKLEAPARAQKAKMIVDAEAEAEKQRIDALAQANAAFARLEAEAKGQYEMLAKKGDGLERIIQACGGAQQAFQMLMLEKLEEIARTSAQAISNVKFDKVVVWEGAGQNSTANFLQSLARTMPPMMQVMKDIGGIEMPEVLGRVAAVEPEKTNGHDTPTSSA